MTSQALQAADNAVDKSVRSFESDSELPEVDSRPLWKQICFSFAMLIVVCALIGALMGVGLAEDGVPDEVVAWIALPGTLFVRAIRCCVIPLIFVTMALGFFDMLEVGKASSVGWKTVVVYLSTTCVAATVGTLIARAFADLFTKGPLVVPATKLIQLGCNSGSDGYVSQGINGALSCAATGMSTFLLNDVNSVFSGASSEIRKISVSDGLRENVFIQAVPSNIIIALGKDNFLGIICFTSVFAIACFNMIIKPRAVLDLFLEIKSIFMKLLEGIIKLTPFAVVSLVAGALARQNDLNQAFKDIGLLIGGSVLGYSIHFFFGYPLLLLLVTRNNPYSYLRFLLPAQSFAFATSSSAATLPVTMKCVEQSNMVPTNIRNFALSLGATINMDGMALYLPLGVTFMAVNAGISDQLNPTTWVIIAIMATLGSIGGAPIPSSELVLTLSIYSTAFNTNVIPEGFAFLVAITWLQGRLMTIVNITGDCVVARVVTEWTKNDGLELEKPSKLDLASRKGSCATDLNMTAHDLLPATRVLRNEA
mmetsp:Transcript_35968/g.34047  ORF Transcript_35968/g.34047 Transcript_35968/m.34047 type:complete len:537 (-) Transcript_35968:213-1823(-)